MGRVLIVDDEPSICWGLRESLGDEGHEPVVAASAEEALALVDAGECPDVILLDVRLPGMDGLTAVASLRERLGAVPIVVMTAFGDLETAVRAVQGGAFEYLVKPFDLDRATDVTTRALALAAHRPRPSTLDDDVQGGGASDGTLVGSSPPMQEVFKLIALVSASDVPVLLTGESGTGKELVARAIHRHGPRRDAPFLPICLAALSPNLVESELFGHVRGSFTGADRDRRGLLELAAGGTVLLDEIGDTETGLQVKLLRALEQREITPVGDPRPRPFDTRIIAATNRPLPELIAAGRFRDDLYFRLSVFHIRLPPLRERMADVPALAAHFLERVKGRGVQRIADAALAELCARSWPGNVRELRNVIEHASIVARGGLIEPAHLPAPSTSGAPGKASGSNLDEAVRLAVEAWVHEAKSARRQGSNVTSSDEPKLHERFLERAEAPLLRTVLEQTAGNKAAAAELLGMHRTTLRQKLRKYGIE